MGTFKKYINLRKIRKTPTITILTPTTSVSKIFPHSFKKLQKFLQPSRLSKTPNTAFNHWKKFIHAHLAIQPLKKKLLLNANL